MYIRTKERANNKIAVQVVEGKRDALTGKVKQKVLRHVGIATNELELNKLLDLGEYIKADLEIANSPSLFPSSMLAEISIKYRDTKSKAPSSDSYKVKDIRQLKMQEEHITGIHDIYGSEFDKIGFNKILPHPSRKVSSQKIIKDIVLSRIANPDSKRGSVKFLSDNCGINLNLDSVYKSMDYITDSVVEKIKSLSYKRASELFVEKIDVLFYDATTLYFESFTEDELKSKGYSKNNKSQESQVILSIFVTDRGLPVGYELFPGNTYEGHTLIEALNKLKQRFNIKNVVFVADSGMLNQDNLNLLEEYGYDYIVGARIKNMSSIIEASILDKSSYKEFALGEDIMLGKDIAISDNRNLIVTYSDRRARKDAADRERSIVKLKKRLEKSGSVKAMLPGSGYKKYMKLSSDSNIEIDENKVEESSLWDGLHGVITNKKDIDILEIVNHYKGLWQVEETFRISKHDLKIRPIYHWTERRIRAHIAICYMALVCARHVEHIIFLGNYKLSTKKIRSALMQVKTVILQHAEDKRIFAIPFSGKDNKYVKIIYKIFGKKLNNTPYLL